MKQVLLTLFILVIFSHFPQFSAQNLQIKYSLPYRQEDIMQCDYQDIYNEQAVAYLVPEFQQSYYHNEIGEINKRHINIDGKDRSIILDYICHYHTKYNFANETFENSIYLFDNIIKNNIVRRCDLRMIATACLFIAAKTEQTCIVPIRFFLEALQSQNKAYELYDCHYVCCENCLYQGQVGDKQPKTIRIDETQISLSTDSDYSHLTQYYYTQIQQPTVCYQCLRQALCNTELLCLQLLNYKVQYVIPLNFLRRYIQLLNLNNKSKYMAFYFAELLLLNETTSQILTPSQIAVAAIAMQQKLQRKEMWPKEMQQFSGFGCNIQDYNIPEKIKDLVHFVTETIRKLTLSNRIQYFRRRYSSISRYSGVSTLIEELLRQSIG